MTSARNNDRARRAASGLMSIGVAAERAGVHPQTLREYERQGLVTPLRTPGGARRYSEDELVRLARIQQLGELGLSLAGIRHVLDLEDAMQHMVRALRDTERRLARYEPVDAFQLATDLLAAMTAQASRRIEASATSSSLALVHVPRPRRTPRWRNS